MVLPDELNDWLTDAGDVVVRKRAGGAVLSPDEQLVYEIWLLDTQARNGGLSQYFGNCGLEQWQRCVAAASARGLDSFAPFAERVGTLIAGARDPYKALIKRGRAADEVYYEHESRIVDELRTKCSTVV